MDEQAKPLLIGQIGDEGHSSDQVKDFEDAVLAKIETAEQVPAEAAAEEDEDTTYFGGAFRSPSRGTQAPLR